MIKVSFPGLGIGEFELDPVAFEVFGLEVRWYGVCITLGMIAAFAYAIWRGRQEGFALDDVLDMGLPMVIFGVIGARAYYVLWKLGDYIKDDLWSTLGAMVNIRGGGLAIYGGIIAGGLTLYVHCRIKKKNWLRALDMVAPGVMIAQAMGRWGNFFNGEAHGYVIPEDSLLYFIRMGLDPCDIPGVMGMGYVHPTFLYESLWNVLGFVLINALLYRRKKFNGQIFFTYIAWYGFGRMLIESLRTDSLGQGTFRISRLVGALCFLCGTVMIIYMLSMIKTGKKLPACFASFLAPLPQKAVSGADEGHLTEDEANGTEDTSDPTDDTNDTNDQTEKESDQNGTEN